MLKKTIQINPDLFNIGSKKKKKKERKKINPFSSALKPNDVKKQLIERVKAHHKKKKEAIENEKKKEQEEKIFTNDFTDTVSYLNDLTKQNKKKREKRRRARKNKKTMKNIQEDIKNNLNYANRPPPPYSNLKNSSKPTYREYNKTLKKNQNHSSTPLIIDTGDMPDNSDKVDFSERKSKLDDLKEKFNEVVATVEDVVEEKKTNNNPEKENKKKYKKKRNRYKTKRIKKKLTLGKNVKMKTVGVLINNKQTRKKIKNDHNKLHTKSTAVVKKYLLKHNLLKVGSTCPEDILRVTYENSYLSGDVINKNPEILLHNYMQDV